MEALSGRRIDRVVRAEIGQRAWRARGRVDPAAFALQHAAGFLLVALVPVHVRLLRAGALLLRRAILLPRGLFALPVRVFGGTEARDAVRREARGRSVLVRELRERKRAA